MTLAQHVAFYTDMDIQYLGDQKNLTIILRKCTNEEITSFGSVSAFSFTVLFSPSIHTKQGYLKAASSVSSFAAFYKQRFHKKKKITHTAFES